MRSLLILAFVGAAIAITDEGERRRTRVVHTPPQQLAALEQLVASFEQNPREKNAENAKVIRPRQKSSRHSPSTLPPVNFPESAELAVEDSGDSSAPVTAIEDVVVESNTDKVHHTDEKNVDSFEEKQRRKKQIPIDEVHAAKFFNGENKQASHEFYDTEKANGDDDDDVIRVHLRPTTPLAEPTTTTTTTTTTEAPTTTSAPTSTTTTTEAPSTTTTGVAAPRQRARAPPPPPSPDEVREIISEVHSHFSRLLGSQEEEVLDMRSVNQRRVTTVTTTTEATTTTEEPITTTRAPTTAEATTTTATTTTPTPTTTASPASTTRRLPLVDSDQLEYVSSEEESTERRRVTTTTTEAPTTTTRRHRRRKTTTAAPSTTPSSTTTAEAATTEAAAATTSTTAAPAAGATAKSGKDLVDFDAGVSVAPKGVVDMDTGVIVWPFEDKPAVKTPLSLQINQRLKVDKNATSSVAETSSSTTSTPSSIGDPIVVPEERDEKANEEEGLFFDGPSSASRETSTKADIILENSIRVRPHRPVIKAQTKFRKTKKGKRALESTPLIDKPRDVPPTTTTTLASVNIEKLRNEFIEPLPEVRFTKAPRRPRLRPMPYRMTGTTAAPHRPSFRPATTPVRRRLGGRKRFSRRPSLRTTTQSPPRLAHRPVQQLQRAEQPANEVDDLILALQREAESARKYSQVRSSLSEDLSDLDLVLDSSLNGERAPPAESSPIRRDDPPPPREFPEVVHQGSAGVLEPPPLTLL